MIVMRNILEFEWDFLTSLDKKLEPKGQIFFDLLKCLSQTFYFPIDENRTADAEPPSDGILGGWWLTLQRMIQEDVQKENIG